MSWILKMSDLLTESMAGGDGGRVCLCVSKSSNTIIPTHASNTHTYSKIKKRGVLIPDLPRQLPATN